MEHYKEVHGVQYETEEMKFNNIRAFFCWKKKMELSTDTRFRITHAYNHKHNQTTVISFLCHRSGFSNVKSFDKIKKRMKDSKKLNAVCPAEIRLLRNNVDSTCSVSHRKTHLGHNPNSHSDLIHLYLQKDGLKLPSRVAIMDPLTKTYFSDLDDDVTDSVIGKNSPSVEKRSKIEVKNNDGGAIHKCNEHGENLETFYSEYSHSIVYYKKHLEPPDKKFPHLEKNDTVLVFMSPVQKSLLQKHGNFVMALDCISEPSNHNFVLHTVLVLDYENEGLPVAFVVSNRHDVGLLDILLDCMYMAAGALQPVALLTGMQKNYYRCWERIMGTPKFHLFSTRAVKNSWLKNLKTIKNKCKRKRLLQTLYALCAETDALVSNKKLRKLLDDGDDEISEFLKYFRTDFVECTPRWAHCYWPCVGVIMNSRLEIFHRSLKYACSRGGKTINLCERLMMIVQFLQCKLNSALFKKLHSQVSLKSKELPDAHGKFVAFAAKNGRVTVKRNEDGWLVQSFRMSKDEHVQETYVVRKLRETCPVEKDPSCKKCGIACPECDICVHLYCCSCVENAMKNNMCQHIYAVASAFKSATSEIEIASSDANFFTRKFELMGPFASPSVEISAESESGNTEDIKKCKENLCRKLSDIQTALTSVQDVNQLKVMEKILDTVSPALPCLADATLLPFSDDKKTHKYKFKNKRHFFATAMSG